MAWGGAHFKIREADYKKVHRPKPYYDSIKYKIINNNPYDLINLCCLFDKRPKQYDPFSCKLKSI